ncbi:hypothetical protein MXE58_09150 [Staphylococcus epidermidis]|nr:hypothetical protein [Staphylococcus epidermidis]
MATRKRSRLVAKSQSVQIKFDEETDYQLRGGMIFLKDNKTKRRTLNNLPVIIDDQIKAEAKHKNLSVNDLYINIIKDYSSKKLENEMSINLNSDLKEILLEVMKNQTYMIDLLEDQQKFFQAIEEE